MVAVNTVNTAFDFIAKTIRTATHNAHREQEKQLAMLAGEPMLIFGKPVKVSFQWPDGLPLGCADQAEFTAEMCRWLAEHRARQP